MPALSELVHEVNRTGQPRLIEADGEVARLLPVRGALAKPKGPVRARAFNREDPLFGLIGIGEGKTPGGVSGTKREALARAYRPK
jgi:hypothetical protein